MNRDTSGGHQRPCGGAGIGSVSNDAFPKPFKNSVLRRFEREGNETGFGGLGFGKGKPYKGHVISVAFGPKTMIKQLFPGCGRALGPTRRCLAWLDSF